MTRQDLVLIGYVAAGGAVGSALRYVLSVAIQERAGTAFPVATLLINITGSLLLGFLVQYGTASLTMSPESRLLLTTGFCGGYTTFSTFSYETARLVEDGSYARAGTYVGASMVLSLVAAGVGIWIARVLVGGRS
jgi:CrcB protein